MFREGKWRLCDVVTGDESWFFYRQIGRKQDNATWIGEGENPKPVVRRSQFEPKIMASVFFKSTGPDHIHFLKNGETINARSYIRIAQNNKWPSAVFFRFCNHNPFTERR